ncbi:hypothetical protein BWP39_12185 [Paraburkholderia acidicola]|uniref:Major facilitator superfamily (MFS) profile domain-containing protein n=1 Tax=Paraburkholderia acidicola TaxID=1912599 RepID=A0A2A4EX51_9BURK|nr:MFS transporter [Paraburkholderia acidicola]PCE25277.1 hypothetical protein BWP39_12185 [Paraburkholderia acidicola]
MLRSQQLVEQVDSSPSVSASNLVPIIVACILVMIDGYDMFIVSFLAPLISGELHLTPMGLGRVFTAGLAGSMAGGVVLGPVADRLGRTRTLVASLVVAGIATILCSRASSFGGFGLLRFVSGFALGGVLTAVVPLVAEHFSATRRSAAVTLMFVGYPLGAVVGGAVTALLYAQGWRPLFLGTGVLLLAAAPLSLTMRETVSQQGVVAESAVRWQVAFLGAFAEGRLIASAFLATGIFCMLLVTYLLTSWIPMIAVRSGMTPGVAALCGVFLNLGGVTGALLSTLAVRKLGVFKLVAFMIATGALCIALIGQFFSSAATLWAMLFLAGALAIGGQQNTPAMCVQLYPRRVRATGAGWMFAAGRIGSMLGPILGAHLLSIDTHPQTMFVIVAVPTLVAALAYATVDVVRPR